jgi:hypothetical protein
MGREWSLLYWLTVVVRRDVSVNLSIRKVTATPAYQGGKLAVG